MKPFYPKTEKCPFCDQDSCRDLEPKDGYICTRKVGHEGEHVACATLMHQFSTWPQIPKTPLQEAQKAQEKEDMEVDHGC